jgi:hypothetical protein
MTNVSRDKMQSAGDDSGFADALKNACTGTPTLTGQEPRPEPDLGPDEL